MSSSSSTREPVVHSAVATLYVGWLRARLRSTIFWTIGVTSVLVVTAAFYPSLKNFFADFQTQGSAGVSSLLGLTNGIDPSSPLGYLWSNLYSNVLPWMLMALGISLGANAIAGDEEVGALEYTLSSAATRAQILVTRCAGVVTILFAVAAVSGLALLATAPLFELTSSTTVTIDGAPVTNPGVGVSNIAAGTFAAFSVATGVAGIAFLIGGLTGKKGRAIGVATAIAVGSYVFYTLANLTGVAKSLTWLSSWRWYIAQAMFINGLGWEVVLPFALAAACAGLAWVGFERRDLQTA
jgi:ABC-2 type transport system permease protein